MTTFVTYAPLVPSPLNPSTPTPRRRISYIRGRVSMSPSERLLRRKAAEAWRSETMYRQVREFERQATQAVLVAKSAVPYPACSCEAQSCIAQPYIVIFAEDSNDNAAIGSQKHKPGKTYVAQLPDLSFLAPTRLVKSVGLWRNWSPRKMQQFLRRSRTSVI